MSTAIGNSVLNTYGTTIFTVMSALAVEHDAINLGQGFPDEDGPLEVRQVAAQATLDGPNQYPPMMGIRALRQAVAAHNARFYDLDTDAEREVLITHGATEALASSILGLINPGDEVVLIEPLYDCYLPMIELAGGVAKLVRIEPPHWTLPRQDLAAAFGPKTKLLILNSPLNPAGVVFNRDDLEFIAGLVKKHNAIAVCDEAYEHLVFDDNSHIPLMSLPGMRARCLRIGSAGKTFSLTGWKIGYITAAAHLIAPVAKAHQFLTFTIDPARQKAVAHGLAMPDSYFDELAADQAGKRDLLAAGLDEIGFKVLTSAGTYFLTADFSELGFVNTTDEPDDVAFCRHITLNAGVTAVPMSAFYQDVAVTHFVRFCFCKKHAVLSEAIARLKRHFSK